MAEIRLTGEGITPGHLGRLRQYLEPVKTAFAVEGEARNHTEQAQLGDGEGSEVLF